ncbi:MAG: hypothetical protein PWQ57_1496 [Desulfovibrionales bacterium]|jgi:hypothetical protein|nr:hypothetical protein [Desulfovibrionales bacterium]
MGGTRNGVRGDNMDGREKSRRFGPPAEADGELAVERPQDSSTPANAEILSFRPAKNASFENPQC